MSNKLTVRELIECLENLPQDMRVLIPGYESGLSDTLLPSRVRVKLNTQKGISYYGPHEEVYPSSDDLTYDEEAILFDRQPNK